MNLVNLFTRNYVLTTPYDVVSHSQGLWLIVLTLIVVALRIMLEARYSGRDTAFIRRIDVFAISLVLATGVVVLNRTVILLPR